MRLFVFSFGTIELVEGIIVIDANLKYKTFEKEYGEILNQSDRNIKKILKMAFDNGEYEIRDPQIEKSFAELLEKLEKYDKPSFNFIETMQPSKEKFHPQEPEESETFVSKAIEEPGILEKSSEGESSAPADELPAQEAESSGNSEEITSDEPIETTDEEQETLIGAAGIQDALASIDSKDDLEEPEIIAETVEEVPISEIEAKSEGIISGFLVNITEHANFGLDHENNIKKADIIGRILLKNAGKRDRIWDINLKLNNIKSTALSQDSYHINELNPEGKWEQQYKVTTQKEIPILFKERINTYVKGSEEIHTLILNQKTIVEFNFFLENQDAHELIDLKLEKKIPKEFTDLKLIDKSPEDTELKVQNNELIWKIPNLKPQQSLNLRIQGKISPTTLENIKTGPIHIIFTKSNDLYSEIVLEDISSISKNVYYIEKDEQEEKPDQWTCRLLFENKSEFPYLLETAEVYTGDIKSDQKATIFRAINEIIQPENEWVSKEWTLLSESIPTFGKKVNFKIIPTTTKSFSGDIIVDEIELPILWAEVKKSYSISEVASYHNTPLDVQIAISIKGTAGINELLIKDFIPENFTPPALTAIKFLLDGKPLNREKKNLELTLKRIPDSDESTQPHQLILQMQNLHDSIGEIQQNSELTIQYPLVAVNPPPEKVYTFAIGIACNTQPVGAPLQINPDMVENSEIRVTHRRRKLTIGKSVYPGAETGEYEIEMMFKNRGNAPIDHAIISDLVPNNFEVISSNPEATMTKLETEMLLEWTFETIDPGKKVEISYKIKGTGEYKTSDAEIFYKV